jgi:hypothetical protein
VSAVAGWFSAKVEEIEGNGNGEPSVMVAGTSGSENGGNPLDVNVISDVPISEFWVESLVQELLAVVELLDVVAEVVAVAELLDVVVEVVDVVVEVVDVVVEVVDVVVEVVDVVVEVVDVVVDTVGAAFVEDVIGFAAIELVDEILLDIVLVVEELTEIVKLEPVEDGILGRGRVSDALIVLLSESGEAVGTTVAGGVVLVPVFMGEALEVAPEVSRALSKN